MACRNSLPDDFLPAAPETAEWFQAGSNWLAARFPGCAGPLPSGLEEIRSPQDLPPGAVLVRQGSGRLAFAVRAPFGMDVHWLKEVGEGLLRGTTGVRVHSAGMAAVRGEWAAGWIAAAVREDADGTPGIRVAVTGCSQRAANFAMEGGWSFQPQSAAVVNAHELASAFLGLHPLHWVRGLVNSLGSRRVEEFVRNAGSTLRAFDALRAFWQSLGARAEAAFWELLQQPLPWRELAARVHEWAGDESGSEPAVESLARVAAGWLPPAALDSLAQMLENLATPPGGEPEKSSLHRAAQQLVRLLDRNGVAELLDALPRAAARELDPDSPGQWALDRLEELLGDSGTVRSTLSRWSEAALKLAAPTAEALTKQWELRLAAGLGAGTSRAALADATFPFTAEGLAAAAQVARGDLSPLFSPDTALLRLRRGLLTETFRRRSFVELHAPMLRTRRKQRDLESFASAEASVTEDGRLQIRYTAQAVDAIAADLRTQTAMIFSAALSACNGEAKRDHFSLSFTDRRQLNPAVLHTPYLRVLGAYGLENVTIPDKPCTASLHVRVAGPLVESWLDTPSPGAPEYLPAMSRAASAVQNMARQWLPALYLSDVESYARPSAVHPLLAWSCSPPCSGPRKKDLTYDFMDPKVVDSVLQACAPAFRERLAETWKFLMDAGRKQTAAYYEPADLRYILASVKRQQRNFVSLLMADAFLVEAVLNTADCAREVQRLTRIAPKKAASDMARFAREMAETFHRKLRRLYGGDDFLALGPLFFLTATSALAATAHPKVEVAAVLILESDGGKICYANEAAETLF
jgi:hypothetical protein